jgi:3-hydroxyacyl-[acyl-carrier-protein] dehydratase
MIDVTAVLPHRAPLLLVDEILELVAGQRVTTSWTPWTDAQVLLLESFAQSAGLVVSPAPDGLMLLGAVRGVEFHHTVRPGSLVYNHVRLVRAVRGTMIFEGTSTVSGDRVLTVTSMVVAYRPTGQGQR